MYNLNLNQFDFNLPEELIAHYPTKKRDNSKLLHYNLKNNAINDTVFDQITNILPKNSVLVLNNTKVIKARVLTKRASGASIECFFIERIEQNKWKVLLKNSKRIQVNESLIVDKNHTIKVLNKNEKEATIIINGHLSDIEFLDKFGQIPLPPYIKKNNKTNHNDRYQSIFASEPGAVAAPTASLHFTDTVFTQLREKNIEIIYITLHIGLGTFNPIASENIIDHKMHKEVYKISKNSAELLNQAKERGQPIIGIGTTAARCLESNIQNGRFSATESFTELFIYPGYKFKAISGLLTNFHLPKSSLLILISSLIGVENTKNAYDHAIQQKYRFFSYGDAMLIT